MNIAAILALLLSSGACAKSDFHAPDGSGLQVVVCPMIAPATPQGSSGEGTPAPDAAPAAPSKEERHA